MTPQYENFIRKIAGDKNHRGRSATMGGQPAGPPPAQAPAAPQTPAPVASPGQLAYDREKLKLDDAFRNKELELKHWGMSRLGGKATIAAALAATAMSGWSARNVAVSRQDILEDQMAPAVKPAVKKAPAAAPDAETQADKQADKPQGAGSPDDTGVYVLAGGAGGVAGGLGGYHFADKLGVSHAVGAIGGAGIGALSAMMLARAINGR